MTENGEHVPRCDACGQKKSNHKGDLERHAVTITHIEAMSLYRDKLQQEASMAQFTLPLINKITSLELKVSILVWEKPMSVSSEESILDVVEKEASTSNQAGKLASLGKTKTRNIIIEGRYISVFKLIALLHNFLLISQNSNNIFSTF
ncbi:Uncharacterized protein APZ42_002314 [Daphnia magna]|uniref:Uncharacterized protein n=1 Tax=Daphnia magna TaxID=35525 RepID=A0A164ICQ0_9CRUS|nr:Uncharacterized protein APZ42_002314 [Daphnia magna]